jgi:phospholipase C
LSGVLAVALCGAPALADNDLEDLPLLTADPGINDAVRNIGKVPLSTNLVGYDPCNDPVADAARTTGCVADGKIEHVVYIILENHTFDNYYGRLNEGETRVPGVDVAAPENDVPQVDDGQTRPFPSTRFHLTQYCGFDDPHHGWDSIHGQVNGNRLDGYVTNNGDAPAMGQFAKQDLAYYYNLAGHSAVADRFFASTATQSWPNHYYTVSATSGGYVNNDLPVIEDDTSRLQPAVDPETGEVKLPETGHVWRTIFDSLEEGGVSWKIYMTNIAIPMAFSNFKKWVATGHVTTIADYYRDVAAGTLPQVAYLAPGVSVSDEHPSTGNHQRGMLQTSSLVAALMASPVWGTSVFFVTYDDSGGWYDHVPPPRAYQPLIPLAGT